MRSYQLLLLITCLLAACSSSADLAELDRQRQIPKIKTVRPTHTPAQFKQLDIEQALQLARANSPALKGAQYRVEAQLQRLEVAGNLPDPELALKTEARPLNSSSASSGEVFIGVRQGLPLGGELSAAEAVAQEQLHMLKLKRDQLEIELEARVRGAFSAALMLQKALALQTKRIDIAGEQLLLLKAQIEAGELTYAAIANANMQQSKLRNQQFALMRKLQSATKQLATHLGISSEINSLLGSLETASDLPQLEQLLANLELIPIVATANSEAQVAHLKAKLAAARRMPQIELELFYRETELGNDAFDAAVILELPLSGRRAANSRAATADAHAAQQLANLNRQETQLQLIELHANLIFAKSQLESYRKDIVPSLEEQVEFAQLSHQAGDSELSELLKTQESLYQAQLGELEAWLALMVTWGDIVPFLPQQ